MRAEARLGLLPLLAAIGFAFAPVARAATPTPAAGKPASAPLPPAGPTLKLPGGRGQHALTVRVEAPFVLAHACPADGPCAAEGGERLPIDPAAAAHADRATLERIDLGGGRQVCELAIPGAGPQERWVMLLAASTGKGTPTVGKPLSGWVGQPKGEPGERRTSVLLHEPARSAVRLVTGTQYEDVSLCGRPATIQARELTPGDMSWAWTSVQSLSAEERAKATVLTAVRRSEPFAAHAPRLLHATAASSATGSTPATLTDGDLASSWSERRPGPGTGEFVLMTSSSAVPVSGFELVVRPTKESEPGGMAPRKLWLATAHELFRLDLPEDAWSAPPGTSYAVDLPKPLRSDCLALVLDDAYESKQATNLTLTELRARTEFDSAADWSAVVKALGEGGPRAEAASALLRRGGAPAVEATIKSYDSLDHATQQRALEVIGAGSCSATASFYAGHILVTSDTAPTEDDVSTVLRDRLHGCGKDATDALARLLQSPTMAERRGAVAMELALNAPAEAVAAIADVLHLASDDQRAELRAALSLAANTRRAKPAVARELAADHFGQRELITRIDLLRAFGPTLATTPGAGAALKQVLATDHSFRTRYLLLAPAGHLARTAEPTAITFLQDTLRADPDRYVRAEAARAGSGIPALAPELGRALHDQGPRVREAALQSLAEGHGPLAAATEPTVGGLLATDPWTFVREAAAAALGAGSSAPGSEAALLTATKDDSSLVRIAALRALGQRKSDDARDRVRAVADEPNETVSVRVAAITTLGQLCDADSLDLLTKLAGRVAAPQLPYDRPLGMAALTALGRIHPADLAARIAPLLGRHVSAPVRQLGQQLLRDKGACK
jgi:HEAT repeat protein